MTAKKTLTPVLMLVPYFAPQSHAAMFRAHKLAKYLPEHGYRPIVVTPDTNYLYNEDPGLLAELPPEVEIHRARYIEPTLRGIRMALGGSDRRFVAVKHKAPARTTLTTPPDAKRRAGFNPGSLVAKAIGNWPDRYWTWSGPAFRLASDLIRRHDIRLLYTSANPVSFLRAATRLKQHHDLTWLFDSRDPLGYGQKHSARGWIAGRQEQMILRKSIGMADHVSGPAQSYGQIFFDLYSLPEERWSFIPTGLDQAYLPPDTGAPKENFLLHVGEVMPNQSPYCFGLLEKLVQDASTAAHFDRLVFVGRREVNEPIIRRMTANLPGLRNRLEFLDHRPQAEVYALMRRARACLLVPGPLRYWWNNFAKMVDYIALGVPVIAHVPAISEARHQLGRAGTAFFLGEEPEQDGAALAAWLAGPAPVAKADQAMRYTAHRQVADFAALFDRLIAAGG